MEKMDVLYDNWKESLKKRLEMHRVEKWECKKSLRSQNDEKKNDKNTEFMKYMKCMKYMN